jgi:hypothetical protein
LSVLKGKLWAAFKLLYPRTEIDWKQLNSEDKIFQEMIVAVSKVYGLELPSEITREVLVDLLSKIDVPESAKRNKRKRKVLFETDSKVESAEKRKKIGFMMITMKNFFEVVMKMTFGFTQKVRSMSWEWNGRNCKTNAGT